MTTLKELSILKYRGLFLEQKKEAVVNYLIKNGFISHDHGTFYCTNADWLLDINIGFILHEKSMEFINRKKGVKFDINYVECTTEELIQKINDIVIDVIETTPC
jgi:hypothetical protein